MGVQVLAQLEVVRAFADITPVVLEFVHHILARLDEFEHAMGGFEEQRVGIDEQGFVRQLQPLCNCTCLAPVEVAVFALPLGQGLLINSMVSTGQPMKS